MKISFVYVLLSTFSPFSRKEGALLHYTRNIRRRYKRKVLQIGPNFEPRNVPEAEVPVPDRLLPKWKSQMLLRRLKLSQAIGLLLFLNREEFLSPGGSERLFYLQSRAPFSALEAGLQFAQRLLGDEKLQSDFQHQLRELNRRPQSKRFRRYEVSRIGVGYRDNGTLPEETSLGRREAQEENFVFLMDLPASIQEYVALFPTTRVGEWVDWEELDRKMKITGRGSLDRQLLYR